MKNLFSQWTKYSKGRGGGRAVDREKFFSNLDTLFDICRCKHDITSCEKPNCLISNCGGGFHVDCNCVPAEKIPSVELPFIRYHVFYQFYFLNILINTVVGG